ncbi:hypothetical protein UlMin_024936 [Ulmus minor]
MPSTTSSCVDPPPIGSPSFQVPPPQLRNYGLNQLVEKLANPLTEEESMSTTTVRGWPFSGYFIQAFCFKKMDFFFRLSCRENGNGFSFNFC